MRARRRTDDDAGWRRGAVRHLGRSTDIGRAPGQERVDAGTAARFLLVAELAVAVAVGAVVIIVTGGAVSQPDGFAALVAWGTFVFVVAGLDWQRRRPQSPIGRLLVLLGFAQALQALQ